VIFARSSSLMAPSNGVEELDAHRRGRARRHPSPQGRVARSPALTWQHRDKPRPPPGWAGRGPSTVACSIWSTSRPSAEFSRSPRPYLPERSRCLHPGQQQGRRMPSSSSSRVRRIGRSRVAPFLASSKPAARLSGWCARGAGRGRLVSSSRVARSPDGGTTDRGTSIS
jgi:hypothetical protein